MSNINNQVIRTMSNEFNKIWIVLGNVFIVLPIQLKIYGSKVFSFFTKHLWMQKIVCTSEVLCTHVCLIVIRHAICPGLNLPRLAFTVFGWSGKVVRSKIFLGNKSVFFSIRFTKFEHINQNKISSNQIVGFFQHQYSGSNQSLS